MSTNIVITVQGLLANPVVADDTKASLERLVRLFRSLASGESNSAAAGTVTLSTAGSAVFGSGTVTFSGAATAADTVTVNGTVLTATQKNATGTASFSTIVAGNSVTIAGTTFTASASPTAATDFLVTGGDTAAAAALVVAVNAYGGVNGLVTATSASAVVTFRAVTAGTDGNAITLTKVGSPISVSGATLANGAAAANNAFDPGNTAATAAAAFAAAVNASSTAAVVKVVSASAAAGVVTLKALLPGTTGNVTLAKSGTNIAVASLTGGSIGTPVTVVF